MQEVPEFIMPKDIAELSEADGVALIESLRERRMKLETVTRAKRRDTNAVRSTESDAQKLKKQYALAEKELKKIDELLTKVGNRWTQIMALRIAIGAFDVEDVIEVQQR